MANPSKVLADTNGIIALLDASDRHHQAALAIADSYRLITKYLGESVDQAFLQDLADGYFRYLTVELVDITAALNIMSRYRGVPLGLVDASIMSQDYTNSICDEEL